MIDAAYLFLSAAFAVEYLVKLYLAPDRWRMVRTHLFDLALIVLPFLRPLRTARALRVLRRVAVAGRAATALRRITARRGFRGFLVVVIAVTCLGGVLMWIVERGHNDAVQTPVDGIWWAITTATTVGYGDVFPVTSEGRAVAVLLMLVGIALVSVVTASIAAFFVEEDDNGLTEMRERLARIEALLQNQRGEPPQDQASWAIAPDCRISFAFQGCRGKGAGAWRVRS